MQRNQTDAANRNAPGRDDKNPTGIIVIVANFSDESNHASHRVGDRYVTAVREICGALPLILPALGAGADLETLLDNIDGVILTGGASNVNPHHYGGGEALDQTLLDARRDGVALELVRACVERNVPLFGICRGIQEMNVALGGSLHQYMHQVPAHFDHRRPREKSMEVQMAPRQRITLTPGGTLQDLANGARQVMVNTLHAQGVDRLAESLVVEAVADDGTIEAVRVAASPTFSIGVQWHAEYRTTEHHFYRALFNAFGKAVAAHAGARAKQGKMVQVA
ncbi:MAG: gamma-glutamyl-gamma-aminobutyrate hydrolase family protein [Alphaproteobacteria bacterium]|jgi:putative glutamine amidotransferase|nr:peptidase C26 [Rhodospirillaceae bacterium]MDP6020241.1 gamma-glutamyl-gamma-aminobutyrate hydrolase family protein [Alphaproteobacteria bacterium]MDP6256083.1 gamma-glutamyl-gamma-aminobutyrate hydrolase family protein [Alphaproteobacteria bacterium]MDP7054313.1 gamma-glutamyl-gamma-aminobutyrate hydrolase family protein [Alphaproteobacteria bacterium]MDP7230610.1 gamma-glutamyl-gamma-aminobutyrate hydrolase family protein [Alphaproteobacteria bacterium]|tara:strand:- start:421 stop:1260 length:840 start_codon:yes stop_codon:yes gene_type:complete